MFIPSYLLSPRLSMFIPSYLPYLPTPVCTFPDPILPSYLFQAPRLVVEEAEAGSYAAADVPHYHLGAGMGGGA